MRRARVAGVWPDRGQYLQAWRRVTLGTRAGTPPYVPRQAEWDMAASRCDSPADHVAFDDHLGDIRVPILCIDRTPAKLGTIERTQSKDVTTLIVNPTNAPALYAHADFFLANNAAEVTWRPVLEWIRERR